MLAKFKLRDIRLTFDGGSTTLWYPLLVMYSLEVTIGEGGSAV